MLSRPRKYMNKHYLMGPSGGFVNPSSADAFGEDSVRDLEVDDLGHALPARSEHCVERPCLYDGRNSLWMGPPPTFSRNFRPIVLGCIDADFAFKH